MTKGIVYYTDNLAPEWIREPVLTRLVAIGLPLVSVSLKPLALKGNVVLRGERGYLTMFRQILAGLELLTTDVAFLCEHDCLYDPSHFAFTPPAEHVYYYNLNWWKVDAETGCTLTYEAKQTAFLCANRQLLIAHYRKRVARVEVEGFSRRMGFEPGSHNRPERVDDVRSDVWRSAVPNIDIRHGQNLTESRWSPDKFRTPPVDWEESDAVPGWGVTKGRFREFIGTLGVAA